MDIQRMRGARSTVMADSIEHRALLSCHSALTQTFQHNLSLSDKLLEKGLVTEEVHGWQLTATAVSNRDKAARLRLGLCR